jgi:energy-converting hydrogenase A subunit M
MAQEVGSQKRKGQMQMRAEYESWYAQIEEVVKLLAEELNMNSETVRQIITEDLRIRNISA